MEEEIKICPQCQAVLTEEEIEMQECFTCGWPNDNLFDLQEE